jgi:hypothetical protein
MAKKVENVVRKGRKPRRTEAQQAALFACIKKIVARLKRQAFAPRTRSGKQRFARHISVRAIAVELEKVTAESCCERQLNRDLHALDLVGVERVKSRKNHCNDVVDINHKTYAASGRSQQWQ